MPFYGETTINLATQTGILLGEYLVHGHDLAGSVGRPRHIDPNHAVLVIKATTALLPLYLDPDTSRGVRITYDIHIRGGPRFVFRVASNMATVESRSAGPVDCRISADPVASFWWPMGEKLCGGRSCSAGSRPGVAGLGEPSS